METSTNTPLEYEGSYEEDGLFLNDTSVRPTVDVDAVSSDYEEDVVDELSPLGAVFVYGGWIVVTLLIVGVVLVSVCSIIKALQRRRKKCKSRGPTEDDRVADEKLLKVRSHNNSAEKSQ